MEIISGHYHRASNPLIHRNENTLAVAYLLLIDGDPVSGWEPSVCLDVVDTVLEVAEALRQVDLQ